jgi:hypothetical protein
MRGGDEVLAHPRHVEEVVGLPIADHVMPQKYPLASPVLSSPQDKLERPVYASHMRQTTSSMAHKKQQVPVGTREKRTCSIPRSGQEHRSRPTMFSAGLPSRHRLLTVQTTAPAAGLPSRRAPSPPACRPDKRPLPPASRPGARPRRRPPVQTHAPAASLPYIRAPPPPAPLGFRRSRIGCRPRVQGRR